ncbi:MAG: carboxypeptidase-like regulatory domain-containing protein [Acidobacteria bacterium]|nr:carboxypeptidase-like regulatory domain-containing protein [Acidobacteriota bacterium]
MFRPQTFYRRPAVLLAATLAVALGLLNAGASAQRRTPPTTGGIKGRVKVEKGSAAGIGVSIWQGEREVANATTEGKGAFEVRGIAPGTYALTLRKPGLRVGRMSEVEIRAGKVTSLKDFYLPIDEGSIAFLRGSVFYPSGRSVAGARVEVALVAADGTLKRIDSRVTTEYGTFSFRLPPEPARYRVTVKAGGMETATSDVEIDSAAIFRVALTLTPAAK